MRPGPLQKPDFTRNRNSGPRSPSVFGSPQPHLRERTLAHQ